MVLHPLASVVLFLGNWRHARAALTIAMALCLTPLSGCGGGGDAPPAPPPPAPPSSPPSPPTDPLAVEIERVSNLVTADSCFRLGQPNCTYVTRPYSPAEFAMTASTGETIMVIDEFPRLPVHAIRYRKRIRGFYRIGRDGRANPAEASWRVPAVFWEALDRFSGPDHVPAFRLRSLNAALVASYASVTFDNAGHGSNVFSLLVDSAPHNPLLLVDSLDLHQMAPAEFCDVSGSSEIQTRLLVAAERAADELRRLMREHGVRYINLSSGHTFASVLADWRRNCTGDASDLILRQKLAAYAPIYGALFRSSGVLAMQAAIQSGASADFPYDQRSDDFSNRLRVGYLAVLDSRLDSQGRGDTTRLVGWPDQPAADIYVNTGVEPVRPFAYNATPQLQTNSFGADHFPITAPSTSWSTPLALSRLLNLRYSAFRDRPMDDRLIADLIDAVVPGGCPGLSRGRCAYQDPLLHGQIEAVRLGYQPRVYSN